MWTTKTFKTKKALLEWVERNGHRYQWQEIFVNNKYAVEYRPLKVIY